MKFIFAIVAGLAFQTLSAFDVVNVVANQRMAWDNLIDVDYEIVGASVGDAFRIELVANEDGGTRVCRASTYRSEPIGVTGRNRVTWDFGADFPGLTATNMSISVTVTPYSEDVAVYCVIDLSAGPTATKYPVRYSLTGPHHVQCARDEPCQTTELWMRRVPAGMFPFLGTASNGGKGDYAVKLSQAFYVGIFECTQRQWYQVTGRWPGSFSNLTFRASRPVESVFLDDVVGHHKFPDDRTVTPDSFVGRIRLRAGLPSFNLPTEAEWEYAMRAGARGSSILPAGMTDGDRIARHRHGAADAVKDYSIGIEKGTTTVGSLLPNGWGLYDCCGNVWELVLDSFVPEADLVAHFKAEVARAGFVTDPVGPPNSGDVPIRPRTTWRHVARGGSYDNSMAWCSTYGRMEVYEPSPKVGVRFILKCGTEDGRTGG